MECKSTIFKRKPMRCKNFLRLGRSVGFSRMALTVQDRAEGLLYLVLQMEPKAGISGY